MYSIPGFFGAGKVRLIRELEHGHINRTYLVETDSGRYIMQSLNRSIFRYPETVMRNIAVICAAFEGAEDIAVPEYLSCDGKNYVEADGEIWRMYRYIEEKGEYSLYGHGYAVGAFLRRVNSCGAEFSTPIEGFHDIYIKGVPMRDLHGDTKADNVIFGEKTTVIDLDTAMRGCIAADYGDMIRSVTSKGIDIEAVREVTEGFADGIGDMLTDTEKDTLYDGIVLVTDELIRRYAEGERNFPNRTAAECAKRAAELTRQRIAVEENEKAIRAIIKEAFA